jgi:hypothetical protein
MLSQQISNGQDLNNGPLSTLVSSRRGNPSPAKDDTADDVKSRIGDEYILVKKAPNRFTPDMKSSEINLSVPKLVRDAPDLKTEMPTLMAKGKRAMMRGRIRVNGKGKREIDVDLFYKISSTSSTNAALAVSHKIQPTLSAEYSALSGLFDEVKVNSGEVSYSIRTAIGGAATYDCLGAVAYDSTYDTTPSSVVEVMECTQAHLFANPVAPTTNNYIGPNAVSKDALHKFKFKIPPATVLNGGGGGGGLINYNFPGSWMAVADTSDSTGYLRIYVENAGTANTQGFIGIMRLHCTFRERT